MLRFCAVVLLAISSSATAAALAEDPVAPVVDSVQGLEAVETVEFRSRLVFGRAVEAAREIESPSDRRRMLCAVATAQAKAGLLNDALGTLHDIGPCHSKAAVLRVVAIAEAEAGQFTAALLTTRKIEPANMKDWALRGIAVAQARAGRFIAALQTARDIESASMKAPTLREIAEEQARRGHFDDALKTAERIERGEKEGWESHSKDTALKAVAEVRIRAARFDEALEAASRIEKLYDKRAARQAIAEAQSCTGHYDAAMRSVRTMENAVRNEELPYEREKGLRELAQARKSQSDQELPTKADFERLFQKIEMNRFDGIRLGIAKALVQVERFDDALKMASEIRSSYRQSEMLSEIATAQAEAGRSDEALETVKRIHDTDSIDAARRNSNPTQRAALDLFYLEFRDSTLSKIVMLQVESGRIDEALQAARCIETASSRAVALVRSGSFVEALDIVQQIENSGHQLRALRDVVIARLVTTNADGARAGFERAFAIGRTIADQWQKAYLLAHLGAVQVRAGHIEEAGRTLDEALDAANRIEDRNRRSQPLCEIASVQAQAGDFEKALHTAQGIEGKWKISALFRITEAQAKAGRFADALQTVRSIEDRRRRDRLLRVIAVAQIDAESFEDAERTMREIEGTNARIEVSQHNVTAHLRKQRFDEATRLAQEIASEFHRDLGLREVVAAQTEIGRIEQAASTAQLIKHREVQSESFRIIASAQVRTGQTEQADAWVASFTDPRQRGDALLAVAECLTAREPEPEQE